MRFTGDMASGSVTRAFCLLLIARCLNLGREKKDNTKEEGE